MSVLTIAPEAISVAAGDLSGVGSAISEANLLASAPTMSVVAPAADSVSEELAALFGGHAQTYQVVSAQGELFHQEFVNTLSASSAVYSRAEAESASGLGKGHPGEGLRVLGLRQHHLAGGSGAGSRLWQPSRPALWKPGMSDPRLVTPRHSLPAGSRLWHPGLAGFKGHNVFAPRLFSPHNDLLGGALNGSRGIVQNIGQLIEQIIKNQISYLKLVGTSLVDFVQDEFKAIVGLPEAFMQSVKDLLHGNIKGSMNDILKGFAHLFVQPGKNLQIINHQYVYSWLGPLADLWQITKVPAAEMQNLADLLKPLGFGYAGKAVQHLADGMENIVNGWQIVTDTLFSQYLVFNPLLAMTMDVIGAPVLSLEAFENGIQSAFDALVAGNPLRAAGDLAKMPLSVINAFLFGQGFLGFPNMGASTFYAHIGGLFAPLDYEVNYYAPAGWVPNWIQYTSGTQTGGLMAALVSMLPPKLQDPFHDLRRLLDGIVAKLMGLAALNY